MSSELHYLGFGAGLLALTGLTLVVGRWARIGLGLFPLWAILRAVVQLTAVAILLRGILAVPWTVLAFVVLMLSTASWTAAGRLAGSGTGDARRSRACCSGPWSRWS